MFKRCVMIAVVAFVATLTAGEASAQKLHAVLAGHTLDPKTGLSARANLEHFVSFLEQLKAVGLDLVIDRIEGIQLSCNELSAAVGRINNLSPDDASIFYYSGTDETIPGPECGDTYNPEKYPIGEVIRRLRAANGARFLITVVDNCNELLPDPESMTVQWMTRIAPELKQESLRRAFQHLFFGYRGALTLSGASLGKPAYCADRGNSVGGAFSNQFLGAIYERISSDGEAVDWKDIAADAAARIKIRANDEFFFQYPQSDIQIGKKPRNY
jgi:hypothetical protein